MKIDDLDQFRMYYHDLGNQLRDAVYDRSKACFAQGKEARAAIADKEGLLQRQRYIRTAFAQCIGEQPASDTPLQDRITGVVPCDGFVIERIVFQSSPGRLVTCNLYLPEGLSGPCPAVLFLCGHTNEGKHADEYQTVCQHLVRGGLIVLAMDPIGQGERGTYYEPDLGVTLVEGATTDHEYIGVQSLLLGKPLAGYFLHDAKRAVDYLLSRKEVDRHSIGVTGNSGGGMQTAMMMLADERIAAAAPGTFIMNRESYMFAGQAQDAEQIWHSFTRLGLDHEDILLAMAPKPVLILAVSSDFFPIEGTKTTYENVKKAWAFDEAESCLSLFVDTSIHQYTEAMAQAATQFFSTHLLRKEWASSMPSIALLKHEELWSTSKGNTLGTNEGKSSLHDELVADLKKLELEFPLGQSLRPGGKEWLEETVYRDRVKVPLNPRIIPMGRLHDMRVESLFWRSQEHVYNHGFLFRNMRKGSLDGDGSVVIALWEGGTTRSSEHFGWIQRRCGGGESVLVLDVTGMGAAAPHPINPYSIHHQFGTLHKLAADLIWLGDSLGAIRVFDVIRAIDLMEQLGFGQDHIHLYAPGRTGLFARLAGLMDNRVKLSKEGVQLEEGLRELVRSKYYNNYDIYSYLIPGVLRYVDV